MTLSPATSIAKESITISPRKPCNYPPSAPGRRLYLFVRGCSMLLALVQLVCVSVAAGALGHKRWLDPSLSPAITTLCHSSIDILCVFRWNRRAHHFTRAIYDGAIAVGFAVAAGFLGRLVVPVMGGERVVEGVLGGVLLYCMLMQVIIHTAICVEGVRDTARIRRDKRREGEAVAKGLV